jgi:hypothetical protein
VGRADPGSRCRSCPADRRPAGKNGQLNVPGLYDEVAQAARAAQRIRALPFNEAKFKQRGAAVKGSPLAGRRATRSTSSCGRGPR